MSIPKHPVSAITEADLQALITGGARETRTLEFKRGSYGGNDDARAEFLADVSSLANTLGGDLLLGMIEDQGTASVLHGMLNVSDVDAEVLRLTQMLQNGLQPRLRGVELHPVPLRTGATALVIRIPRSYTGPHRVVFNKRNRFWARNDGGKFEPDTDELRALFTAAPLLAGRIREMRADRVASVLAGETPVPLKDHPGLTILHIVPFSAAGSAPAPVDLDALRSRDAAWLPWGGSGYNERRNFDGFVTFSGQEGQASRAYIQVFRSGMVEVVACDALSIRDGARTVWVDQIARTLVQQLMRTLPGLRAASVDPPYSVQLTVAGVRGATFADASNRDVAFSDPPLPVTRDVLTFVDAVVDQDSITPEQVATAIRPILDQLFETAAAPTTPWFNPDGSLRIRMS